jgi:hypothetical protein
VVRKAGILLVAAALGAGASAGVAACGEDRGSLTIEGGGSGTEGTGTSTSPTETAPTETETTPRTVTER